MWQLAAFFSTHTLHDLLANYGYVVVVAFVMAESLGVPVPGETMLITAAIFAAATGDLTVVGVWAAAAAGAVVGDNIGFALGYWGGYRLLRRHGQKVRIDERKLKVGRLLFDRHGGKVVFFGRFVSILRTYAAFLAGTNHMPYPRFLGFNAGGGIIWSAVFAYGAYYFGRVLEHVKTPVDVAIGAVALALVVAGVVWTRRNAERLGDEAEAAYPGSLPAR